MNDNNKTMMELVNECADKITKLGEEQDELFSKLVTDVGNTGERFVDAMFDYCYNGGDYTKKFFNKLVEETPQEE